MIAWVQAIEDLLVNAPGNADAGAGDLWDSFAARFGAATPAAARERVYWDLLEAEDVVDALPFTVLKHVESEWQTPGMIAYPMGEVHLFVAEAAADPTGPAGPVGIGAAHKRSLIYFGSWIDQLIAYIADQANAGGMPAVTEITQLVEPQRTPRMQRDLDRPESDYWWVAYRIGIGKRVG
jgi:hypothetical protein